MTADGWPHLLRPGAAAGPAILALHGTGGDEADLLPFVSAAAPGLPVLSPRGPVREGAANRWFRRFAEGVFDLDDLRARAAELSAWIAAARSAHPEALGGRRLVAVGYSNGANIAAALLLLGLPGIDGGAALLRGQFTLPAAPGVALGGLPAALVSGTADPVVPPGEAAALRAALERAGAKVTLNTVVAGHGIGGADVAATRAFLAGLDR